MKKDHRVRYEVDGFDEEDGARFRISRVSEPIILDSRGRRQWSRESSLRETVLVADGLTPTELANLAMAASEAVYLYMSSEGAE